MVSMFVPCASAQPADWIGQRLTRHPGTAITSVVPKGFARYIRVLHPFLDLGQAETTTIAVSELARRLGRRLRPLAPTEYLVDGMDEQTLNRARIYLPRAGDLPATVATAVAAVLGQHTSTPDDCYFAIWNGWAALQPEQGFGAQITLPARTMYLYSAPVSAAAQRFDSLAVPEEYAPNVWWPADHSWYVTTEVDYRCTYIGCGDDAAQHLTESGLDTVDVRPTDPPEG